MDGDYLGYVSRFDPERLIGRIRPLALLKSRSTDHCWVVARPYEKGELGETDRVFWFDIARNQNHHIGEYVRFRAEANRRPRDPERDWDEYVVAEGWKGNPNRVSSLGIPTISADRWIGPELLLDANSGLRPGTTVYQRRMKDTLIDGPWRVAEIGGTNRLRLEPKENGYVVEYASDRLGETLYDWDHKGETQIVLLVEPPKSTGEVIDLLTDAGLADWLIRVLRRDKPLLASLDGALPGWRGRLGELLEGAIDPVQKTLEERRFARLETALEALAVDEARLADLIELPRFKAMLDAAIKREVESEGETIKAAAVEATTEFVARQRQEREKASSATEREKTALLRKLEQVQAEVAAAERQRDEDRARVERDETSIRAAADYLIESRERITRDFTAFHGLIEAARGSGNHSASGHPPVVATVTEVASMTKINALPEGPAIDDQSVFLQRMGAIMASWGAEASPLQVRQLHAAIVSCQWVAAPCPSWGVAYVEAIGADALHRIVAAEPTWLSFSDVWRSEVEAVWHDATERRDTLHLLIFADADRALVQCWARPMLDILSGLRLALPSGLPWPENLRVMSCPAADEAALPVPDWVVAHWAGIKASFGSIRLDGPIVPGHVPFATWRGWCMTPSDSVPLPTGLGVAARSSASDRSALARVLLELAPDDDPERAAEMAKEIREVHARTVFQRRANG